MRELIYTLLELEWEFRNRNCDFCSNLYGEDNKGVNQIRTRSKLTNELIDNDVVCEDCKEKFLNDEIPKCERCGRLQNETYVAILCRCIRNKEDLEEKELPSVPYESQAVSYERQINALREEKTQLEEEVDVHLEALEVSEVWSKEKIDKIKELETKVSKLSRENEQLKEQNKKIIPEELASKIELYEKEIERLKAQLEKLSSQQQTAQTEVKTDKKFRFLSFARKP